MNAKSELEQIMEGQQGIRWQKGKHICSGSCFCTGRCMYTEKEWRGLQEMKDSVRFTGVDEMKNKID